MAKQTRRISRAAKAKQAPRAKRQEPGAGQELPLEAQEKIREIAIEVDRLKATLADMVLQQANFDDQRQTVIAAIREKQTALHEAASQAVQSIGYDLSKQQLNIDLKTMRVSPRTEK